MPTHPEVVTLDPNDAGLMGELWHAAKGTPSEFAEHVRALVNPLPEEPSLWSVAKAGQRLFVRGQSSDSVGRWFEVSPGQGMYAVTWPEVCALGTPEVLEPDSVKALREGYEREHRLSLGFAERASKAADKAKEWEGKYDAMEARALKAEREVEEFIAIDIDRSAATENEPAEPAPVEVTEEPTDRNARVRDEAGDVWHRVQGNPNCFTCWTTDGILHLHWDALRDRNPLTLVETGGQS